MIKTCTLALAAFVAVATATPCNMGEIQGKLLANATEGLKNCASTTGYDIWATDKFPTEDQAQKIMKTRDCVAFINQINERANQDIQCDIQVGGVQKDLGQFFVSLLTGKTGNETEAASASGSADKEVTDGSAKEDDEVVATVKPKTTDSSTAGNAFTPVSKVKATNSTPTTAPTKASAAPMAARAVVSTGILAAVGLALL